MSRTEIAVAIISGLLVNEATDICPWVAVRLVRWAARLRYRHAPVRAATRGEELAALVHDRPGKLFKLVTALGFAVSALTIAVFQVAPRGVRRLTVHAIRFTNDHRAGVMGYVAVVGVVVLDAAVLGVEVVVWAVLALVALIGTGVAFIALTLAVDWAMDRLEKRTPLGRTGSARTGSAGPGAPSTRPAAATITRPARTRSSRP